MNICIRLIDSCGLGDEVCASTAIYNYYLKTKYNIYVSARRPSLYNCEDHIKGTFNDDQVVWMNDNNFWNSFDKVINLTNLNHNHLMKKTNIVESYCEELQVEKQTHPIFFIKEHEVEDLKLDNNLILTNLIKDKEHAKSLDDNEQFSKYLSYYNFIKIFTALEQHFPKYKFIDISNIQHKSWRTFLILSAACKAFISVDSALIHIAANQNHLKPGIVLWNSLESKINYGYDNQINLYSDVHKTSPNIDINTILNKFDSIL